MTKLIVGYPGIGQIIKYFTAQETQPIKNDKKLKKLGFRTAFTATSTLMNKNL